ncbi:hypothetical protein [Niastella sp. OAS944]|uniref:hypothetical protein n=1 Tax=Niastella sp. OAS944 TaxID=2664089 RepID=UPI00348FD124|nr:hypothetical protein [Chitinophagaceae bacterium OAS944]
MRNIKLLYFLQPFLLFLLLNYVPAFSQLRWDGEAGDGQWMTASNWVGNIVPGVTDEVILDNVFVSGTYSVTLPGGNSVVQIRSVTIAPGAGNNIELILPATNTAIPAFKLLGAVYGMVIENGGIFKNSSGVDNDLPVEIADSIMIKNGGRYIQNSDGSHAANVMVLSKAPGTEEGAFEFDIPSASSTVSLSGRTYGKLVFLSNARKSNVTYTATGTNTITIKSDLVTGPGVTLSLNFSDTLHIGRDLIQQGSTINLGNSTRSLVTVINRHFTQSDTSLMYETGTASPELVLAGNTTQQIDCKGTIKNNISVKMNNTAGALLIFPWSLPYKLNLVTGKIKTSQANILKLLAGCEVVVDSLSNNSFIDGPVRKEGLSSSNRFLFPVGKENTMRWLTLKIASGNYNVEYINSNPQQVSNKYGAGINHVAQTGYWTIQADASPVASASVELSFSGLNSGVGTNLATARVARLNDGVWLNYGNTVFTGTAGSRGSVASDNVDSWSAAADSFVLGSSVAEGSLALDDTSRNRRSNLINNNSSALQLLSINFNNYTKVLACRVAEKTTAKLCVVNNNGQLIKVLNVTIDRGMNYLPIDMPLLPSGIYTIYALTAKGASNTLRFASLR